MTTTSSTTFTYMQTGANSTSSGGSVSLLTGGFALYPMAEVLQVYNPVTRAIDGQMKLAANTVNWAAGDALEQPHYFQEKVSADLELVTQYTPRPVAQQQAGISYQGNNGPGLRGWAIFNTTPASNYFGNGGTHNVPDFGMQVAGPWLRSLDVQAGDEAVVAVHCNSHGCGRWNSGYNLFEMDSNAGQDRLSYSPLTSALSFSLRGTGFTFDPSSGFTTSTVNVNTLNAQTLSGTFTGSVAASSLPVFGASGGGHAVGAVPDPGATAGTTRFLREDGTWAAAGNSTAVVSVSGFSTTGPVAFPQRSNLLGEYLLSEGTGTVAHDTSGQGNDGTISGATWEGTTDLNFTANGDFVQLPAAVNAARAWQIALYAPVFGSASSPQAPGYGLPGDFGDNPSVLCGTDGQHLCLIATSIFSPRSQRFYAVNTDQTEAAVALTPGWHVLTLLCGSNVNGVVSKTHLLYDGTEVGSYVKQGDAGTCPTPSSGNYQLGGSAQLTGTWWLGKIAAAWAWGSNLSLSDGEAAAKSALGDYMRSKGVPAGFSPVVSSTPLIVAGLDSRTYGLQLTPTTVWPATMVLTDTTYARVNLGMPGQVTLDACNQFDLTYGEQVLAGLRAGDHGDLGWGERLWPADGAGDGE